MFLWELLEFVTISARKILEARLLNLALYNKTEMEKVIDHYLDLFNPTHVGLVFHWQETAEGFIWVGEYIKSHL